jgi:hypothetical protein
MEKHLVRWGYLLGLFCFAIGLVWRALNLFGGAVPKAQGQLFPLSFYKGALMFLLITIATANYSWFRSQKP